MYKTILYFILEETGIHIRRCENVEFYKLKISPLKYSVQNNLFYHLLSKFYMTNKIYRTVILRVAAYKIKVTLYL